MEIMIDRVSARPYKGSILSDVECGGETNVNVIIGLDEFLMITSWEQSCFLGWQESLFKHFFWESEPVVFFRSEHYTLWGLTRFMGREGNANVFFVQCRVLHPYVPWDHPSIMRGFCSWCELVPLVYHTTPFFLGGGKDIMRYALKNDTHICY